MTAPISAPAGNVPEPGSGTFLVLGGTGKTGRRVADRLTAAGHRVRIGSRSAELPFDWADPDGWPPVVQGVSAVYLAYAPDIGAPEAAERVGAFARLAAANGVRRVVLLSARGMKGVLAAEEAVRTGGTDWTVVRGSWFAQNFSEEFLCPEVLAGTLVLPAGDHAEPFVDLEDLADVAVAALTEDGHAGRTYEVTGPRALTWHEVAAEISRATGREIVYRPLSHAGYTDLLAGQGVPREVAEIVTAIAAETLDGTGSAPTDTVRRVLGREAADFTGYVTRTAPTGVWNP